VEQADFKLSQKSEGVTNGDTGDGSLFYWCNLPAMLNRVFKTRPTK